MHERGGVPQLDKYPQFRGSLSKAGADIAVESWVSEFRPCLRFCLVLKMVKPYLGWKMVSHIFLDICFQSENLRGKGRS